MRVLLGREILVVGSSLSVALNISCHSLLACRVSLQLINVMGVSLYVICCFSLVAFTILSFSLIFVSLTLSQCVPPWIYPV